MVFKTLAGFSKGQKCQLCLTAKVDPEALGNICQTADVIVHYFCLLLASKIQQKGTDKQGLLGFFSRDIKKEIKRGSTIVCNYCKKNGATVMCSRESCHLNFHVPCAQQKGSLHQYFNQFKSFCEKHKPRQKIPASLKNKKDLECVLCSSHVKFNVRSHEDDPIWPTCCKPQALLHKRCLQHFATSSGYYFKCPFCSNKEEFHKGMKTYGIYIPEQEASWETEPNAYRELLERDVSCDAGRCRCPRGPLYSVRNSKWYLEVCILCGASGRHRGCMLESIMTDTYECDICSKVNKKYPNSVPPEDIPESSPLSDRGGECETVQQSVEGNISKNLSLECEEIVVISDSESENDDVQVIDVIHPTKNIRKRQLPIRQEKRSGLKRQRLAEGGAETSSEMCFTIDEESRSPLAQTMDNPSFETELDNNPQACEINFANRESINEKTLLIEDVYTLSSYNPTEIDQLHADNSNSNEGGNNQNHIQCVNLVSDNEIDEVLVISDTDSESISSSLFASDSSLLDLSEIPESEKSLLLENFSPPYNYAKEFSRRIQTPKKRRKKKKQMTQKKKKTSIQNLKPKSNTKDNETSGDKQINISINPDKRNLEPTSSQAANTNIPSCSHLVNGNSSEDESFRGFCCEEIQSNNESVEISTTILVKGSLQEKKISSNEEKNISSLQHMSGNHIFLSSVDDTSKCVTLDSHNLIDKVKNIKCQVANLDENAQPKCTDDNTVKTISNLIVLKLLEKDDKNCNKSVSNNCELSKCKINNCTNVSVTSIQEVCSNKSSIDTVICNSNPSKLSRNIKTINHGKFDSEKHEGMTVSHQTTILETTNVNNLIIEEDISKNESKKTKSKPVTNKRTISGYDHKMKRPLKNINKPKILCSLPLEQSFGKINHSLCKLKELQNHKNKSCNKISSGADVLAVDNANIADLRIFDIPVNRCFNASYNTIEDSQLPKQSELQLESQSPKSCREIFLEPYSFGNCNESPRESESPMHTSDLPLESLSSERVSNLVVSESLSTSEHQKSLERSTKKVPLNLISLKNLLLKSPIDISQTQVKVSSDIATEVPLNSKLSENISEISPVGSSYPNHFEIDLLSSKCGCESSIILNSSETMNKADLESQVFTKHSESHQNSLLKKHSVITISADQIESKNSVSNLDIQIESKSSSESEVESIPSKFISEFPKKSDTSPVVSQEPSIVPESSKLNSDVESKLFAEHSEPHQSSPVEKHSVNASLMQKTSKNSESSMEIQTESKSSSESKIESVSSKCISEFPMKSDTSLDLFKSDLVLDSSALNSECSDLLEDEANLKVLNINTERKLDTFQFPVNSPFRDIQFCKLNPTKSLEVSMSSELTLNLEECKPSKIKDCKEKPNDSYEAQRNNFFPIKPPKLNTPENLTEFRPAFKHLKHKEQGKPKPEVKVDLQPSKVCLSQEQLVSETRDFFYDSFVHLMSNDCVKPDDLIENNLSVQVSKVDSCVKSQYPCDESQTFPPLDEEFSECFKNLVQTNKRGKLKADLNINDINPLPIEIKNNLKDVEDSSTLKNQDPKTITQEMDENNVDSINNFEKQMLIEDSKVESNIETKFSCDKSQSYPPSDEKLGESFKNQSLSNNQENLNTTLTMTEEYKLSLESDSNLKDIAQSVCHNGKISFIKNQNCENIKNDLDENNVNVKKHNRYKICITDCSTCYNSVTLTAKHNIVKNDSTKICFYCKDKINNISVDIPVSQDLSTCSCQENKNNFSVNYFSVEQHHKDLYSEVFKESKLSKDYSLVGGDLNSNYKSSEPFKKQNSPSNDQLKFSGKEINSLEAKSLKLPDVLSLERSNMTTESEQHPISNQVIPEFIGNSLSEVTECEAPPTSKKKDPEISKVKSVANTNIEPTDTLNKYTIRQISADNDNEREYILRRYYSEVFKVRIFLKEVDRGNNNSPSLMSHVETFWIHNRKLLRELLKAKYFSEKYEKLVVYTDVCGFRYTRLFVENIPEKIEPRVVFESGGDISYYLQKLIRFYKTEQVINPQIILIVYGNSLIPDRNVFHLLQLASNLNNIKLVVTTVPSQKPIILRFNRKLIYYSKRFGYDVWDITKIHFLPDINR